MDKNKNKIKNTEELKRTESNRHKQIQTQLKTEENRIKFNKHKL